MKPSLLWRAAVLVVALSSLSAAGHGHLGHDCPECGHKICHPVPTVTKVKKHCFEVQCKDICIPGIKGPHRPCCEEPPCGRVRTVKVLKKVEFECEQCGYKWDVPAAGCKN